MTKGHVYMDGQKLLPTHPTSQLFSKGYIATLAWCCMWLIKNSTRERPHNTFCEVDNFLLLDLTLIFSN